MAKTPAERAQAYRDRIREMHGLPCRRNKTRPPLTCAERKRTSRERKKLQKQQCRPSPGDVTTSTDADPSTSSTLQLKNLPRTAAERLQAYRERRKSERLLQFIEENVDTSSPSNDNDPSTSSRSKRGPRPKKKPPQSVAERMRAYRARKKLQRLQLEEQLRNLCKLRPMLTATSTEENNLMQAIWDEKDQNVIIKVEPACTRDDDNNGEFDELPPPVQVNVTTDYDDDDPSLKQDHVQDLETVESSVLVPTVSPSLPGLKQEDVKQESIDLNDVCIGKETGECDRQRSLRATPNQLLSAQLCQNSLGQVMIQLLEKPSSANEEGEEDDDELYLRSLLPILKQFDAGDKLFVKVEIMNTIRRVQTDVWNRRPQNSHPS